MYVYSALCLVACISQNLCLCECLRLCVSLYEWEIRMCGQFRYEEMNKRMNETSNSSKNNNNNMTKWLICTIYAGVRVCVTVSLSLAFALCVNLFV